MQGEHGHLSREQKQLALRLHGKGWRLVDIAKEIGCSAPMVGIMARTDAAFSPADCCLVMGFPALYVAFVMPSSFPRPGIATNPE